MNVRDSTGECQLCGVELEPTAMTKHLAECLEQYRMEVGPAEERTNRGYQIAFQVTRAPMYWIHLHARSDAILAQIDALLRDLWMEDRQKESRFRIGRNVYSSERPAEPTPGNLKGDLSIPLEEIVENDVPFTYTYDMEQTTEVEGRVVDRRYILPDQPETPVRLLARNTPPSLPCACGSDATWICSACFDRGDGGLLCEACAEEHSCPEKHLSELSNTPRALVTD